MDSQNKSRAVSKRKMNNDNKHVSYDISCAGSIRLRRRPRDSYFYREERAKGRAKKKEGEKNEELVLEFAWLRQVYV